MTLAEATIINSDDDNDNDNDLDDDEVGADYVGFMMMAMVLTMAIVMRLRNASGEP